MQKNNYIWAKIIGITIASILLVIGFSLGYLYHMDKVKECESNPLMHGIKEMNELNNIDFQCTCNGGNKNNDYVSFRFNEDEMKSLT